MSHPGTEYWKVLGCLIGYIRGKETKRIVITKTKVLKSVIFSDSNNAIEKETRNIVSGLVTTPGGTLITCLSNTQRTVTLISTYKKTRL